MISPSFPSHAGTNLARKLLVLMLLIASAPSIASISVPVSAETPTEDQMTLLEELLSLLESSYINTKTILEFIGDNESLPMAYEKLRLGEESAMMALSLNSTGSYTEAYNKALEAMKLYEQAIILAQQAEPEPGDESSPENTSYPLMVQAALERAWNYLDEVNSTYQAQGVERPEVETLISDAFTQLQCAEEMFAEGNYDGAAEAESAASEALDGAMEILKEHCRENKAERAIKFLDIRRNSLKGLEDFLTQMRGEADAEVSEVFLTARNANQLIRTLIENGEIEEALSQLDEIHARMYQSLEEDGLSRSDVKRLKAIERVTIKARRLSKKITPELEEEPTDDGEALGMTDDDGGIGNSTTSGKGKSTNKGKGKSKDNGKGKSNKK